MYGCVFITVHLFQNIEPYAGQEIELFSSDSEDDEVGVVSYTEFKL